MAERKNRLIVEMALCMLKGQHLGNELWAAAVQTTIYILNRSPTRVVQGMTPEEAWSGRKPQVNHFKIFGSTAYALVPEKTRHKLDDKSTKCIFIGYSTETKGYKLYDPTSKKIIVSRDVVFDEDSNTKTNDLQSCEKNDHIKTECESDEEPKSLGISSQSNKTPITYRRR